VLARTVVTGPLAPYAAGWRAELAARGFAPHSITAHAQLTAHLSGWLADTNQGLDALSDEVVEEYLRARGAAGYRSRTTVRAMAPLLGYLRGLRIVPQSVAPLPVTPIEVLIAEFGDYLANERGLVPATVHHHRRFARLFLTEVGVSGELGLAGLTAATVTSFTVSQATRRSAPVELRTALRTIDRHVCGYIDAARLRNAA
jgi:site-specific recombinase XerD